MTIVSSTYAYEDAAPSCAHAYLWPAIRAEISKRHWPDKRAFDLGCGNGATGQMLSTLGFEVAGIDPSEAGIAQARAVYPHLDLRSGSSHDDVAAAFGTFPLLVSLEVVEHVYAPRVFAKTAFDLLEPDGLALISTPYHGYLAANSIGTSRRSGTAGTSSSGRWRHSASYLPRRASVSSGLSVWGACRYSQSR